MQRGMRELWLIELFYNYDGVMSHTGCRVCVFGKAQRIVHLNSVYLIIYTLFSIKLVKKIEAMKSKAVFNYTFNHMYSLSQKVDKIIEAMKFKAIFY